MIDFFLLAEDGNEVVTGVSVYSFFGGETRERLLIEEEEATEEEGDLMGDAEAEPEKVEREAPGSALMASEGDESECLRGL